MVDKREATSPTRNVLMKGHSRILYSERFPRRARAMLFLLELNSGNKKRWEHWKKISLVQKEGDKAGLGMVDLTELGDRDEGWE